MRPIKFRAWYKNEKLMLPIAEITFHKDWDIIAFPLTREAISSYLVWGNVVLMQSTWLRDKNGRDIYEGDIVKRDDKSDGKWWRFAVVELNPDIQFNCSSINEVGWIKNSSDYTFRYWQFAYKDTESHLTIIGNIYENPELIKQ